MDPMRRRRTARTSRSRPAGTCLAACCCVFCRARGLEVQGPHHTVQEVRRRRRRRLHQVPHQLRPAPGPMRCASQRLAGPHSPQPVSTLTDGYTTPLSPLPRCLRAHPTQPPPPRVRPGQWNVCGSRREGRQVEGLPNRGAAGRPAHNPVMLAGRGAGPRGRRKRAGRGCPSHACSVAARLGKADPPAPLFVPRATPDSARGRNASAVRGESCPRSRAACPCVRVSGPLARVRLPLHTPRSAPGPPTPPCCASFASPSPSHLAPSCWRPPRSPFKDTS